MYVVTGGAGFIGSNLVRALNERGIDDVVVVDNLEHADKFANLVDCEIADYVDKRDLLALLDSGQMGKSVKAIFHQGACSDTMERNGLYMMQNNYDYSKSLLHYCQKMEIPLLYASSGSVYGSGRVFREDRNHESPLNVYGYSKFLFDQYVRRILPTRSAQIVGFRYFNVYGDREQHKERMASVAYHFFHQYRESGRVKLFEGSDGYGDGEQRRDFVSIEDVVKVNFFFLDNPTNSGIFNVGTGRSQTFNDVAVAVINTLRKKASQDVLTLGQIQQQGLIEYIPFPEALRGKYQSYTEADVGALTACGYTDAFLSVEEGVARYIQCLLGEPAEAGIAERREARRG